MCETSKEHCPCISCLMPASALLAARFSVPGFSLGRQQRSAWVSRRAAAMRQKGADNFAFGRTDEHSLSAEDASLPRRARELIRIGDIGIAKENQAAMDAFFHPQFRFHGPGGAELNREQLWNYFASCRAAFDDFTVTRDCRCLHSTGRSRPRFRPSRSIYMRVPYMRVPQTPGRRREPSSRACTSNATACDT